MTQLSAVRRIINSFALVGREVAMIQREGDVFDTVRLAYTDALDDELGRVVNLSSTQPRLATALAVWTTSTRNEVVATVHERWRDFEREVIG